MEKVLHVIKTKKLRSDGRLLKWIESLQDYDINSEVLILEDENASSENNTDNVPIKRLSLSFRKLFSKQKGYVFKIPEYSIRCFGSIYNTKADVILFHDVQQYLNVLIFCLLKKLSFKKKIIWDLHELPHEILLRFGITKRILKYLLKNVDGVIYTNEERRLYLKDRLNCQEKRFVVLNNYPDESFINAKHASLPDPMSEWLDGMPYVLWMGFAGEGRNFQSFIKIYEKHKSEFKVIIMGQVADEFKDEIESYIANKNVYVTFVAQSEIQKLVDNALFSVVLYPNISPNNFYCEPNRLYQLITRKVPVIVGNNPTMLNFVKKYNAGIVLNDDGTDSANLDIEMKNMSQNVSEFRTHLKEVDFSFLSWEKQFQDVYVFLNEAS